MTEDLKSVPPGLARNVYVLSRLDNKVECTLFSVMIGTYGGRRPLIYIGPGGIRTPDQAIMSRLL